MVKSVKEKEEDVVLPHLPCLVILGVWNFYRSAGTPITAYFLRAGHKDLTSLSCSNIYIYIFFFRKRGKTFFDASFLLCTEQSNVHSSVLTEEGMYGSGLMYARLYAVRRVFVFCSMAVVVLLDDFSFFL